MSINAGDCYLIETNIDNKGYIQRHLYVVVLQPVPPVNQTIIVNIDKYISKKQDSTVLLDVGDHPFISLRSFVNYNRAKLYSAEQLQILIDSKRAKRQEPMNEEVFQRVCNGFRTSKRISARMREIYVESLY